MEETRMPHSTVPRTRAVRVLVASLITLCPGLAAASPATVSLLTQRAGAGAASQGRAATEPPIEGIYWRAIELAGKPTPAVQDPQREAHLEFQPGGRVSGSDGCNRIAGTYERRGDRVVFGEMAGTRMACLNTSSTEEPFRDALKNARRLVVEGDRLELLDDGGARLAVFEASRHPSGEEPRSP
jgi:putative lipoprotein